MLKLGIKFSTYLRWKFIINKLLLITGAGKWHTNMQDDETISVVRCKHLQFSTFQLWKHLHTPSNYSQHQGRKCHGSLYITICIVASEFSTSWRNFYNEKLFKWFSSVFVFIGFHTARFACNVEILTVNCKEMKTISKESW